MKTDLLAGPSLSSPVVPLLHIQALSVGYVQPGSRVRSVLSGLNADLRPGEMACLIGPNGIGKTTLLRTIAGLLRPLAGAVRIFGQDVHHLHPRDRACLLSVVLSERVDVGLMTAFDLVALGRHPHTGWNGALSEADYDMIAAALEAVGAASLIDRYVSELSDGERQKVMIARALAQQSAVILLDEPTAFLDLPRRVEIMQMLRGLSRRGRGAILLSTHDLDLALRTADRLWLLSTDGDLQVGAPEDLVLSGALAEAFRSEGVSFDAITGAFQVSASGQVAVNLEGEGPAAVWTQRALERTGYRVAEIPGAGAATIQVIGPSGSARWQLTMAGRSAQYDSLQALLSALAVLIPPS